MIAYIDELEADLLDILQKTFIEREVEIQNKLEDFKLRKLNVCEMQENVTIVQDIASEFQFFMAIREFTKSANIAETDLQQLFNGGSFNWVEILYTPTNLKTMKDIFQSVGKTDVRIGHPRIMLKVRKTQEAQLIGPIDSSRSIESIQLKERVKGRLPKGKKEFDILDCGYLLDGNLVFTDRKNNRLIIFDTNCVFVRNLSLSFSPVRFAVIDEVDIAITTGDGVNIVNLEKGVVVKTLIRGSKVGSIILINDNHLMVEILGGGYKMIDLNGNIKKTFQFDFSDTLFHTHVCIKERLYYVDSSKATLYGYDFDGNEILKFENKIFQSAIAFTSDKSNILFCSGFNSKNVFVVSTDGKSSKEIIKSNVYLSQAVAAHYNINNRELLIATKNGNFILYDVI